MARKDDIDLWHLAYKHRRGLAPVYLGAATAAVGGLTEMLDTGQTAIGVGTILLAGTALIRNKIQDGLRRAYAYTVLGASTSWVMVMHELNDVNTTTAALIAGAGTVGLGFPWWLSQRRHKQVQLDELVQDWPRLAKRIGIGNSTLVSINGTTSGYTGKITWPGGVYDVDNVRQMTRGLEGVLPGAKRGKVRTTLDGDSTNSIRFQVIERDPHALAQMWEPPMNLRRGTDVMVTGIKEDGEDTAIQLFDKDKGARHVLIGGQSESGKSSLVNLIVANDVISEDTWTAGFDFKRVELGPWRPALGYMTHEIEKARKFVHALAAPGGAIDARTEIMERNNARVWNPAWGPWISLVIDEAKNLLGSVDDKFMKLYTRIKTEGRAVGIGVKESTQYPTLEALGSSQGRQQNRYAFCFRMLDSEGETYTLGKSAPRVYAERISEDRPGTCYRRDGATTSTAPERIRYIDNDTRDAVIAARAGLTVELDAETEASITALFPEFAERERYHREIRPDGETVLIPVQRGTGGGTGGGTATGTEDGDDIGNTGTDDYAGAGTDEEPVRPTAGLDDGPDVNLADVVKRYRDALPPESQERMDRDREAALAEMAEQDAAQSMVSEDEALTRLRAALIKAGDEGAAPKDLQAASGRGSTWFYERMGEWAEREQVKRVKHGRWAWTGPRLVTTKSDVQ